MSEFAKEIEARLSNMWENKPADIDSMLERKGAAGSNLTIVLFVKTDVHSAANMLYMLYNLAKSETGDLWTLQKFTADFLSFLGMRFKNYYLMDETHSLSLKAAVKIRDTRNYQEYAELVNAVQRYYGQLDYWVDFTIQWCELSKIHERLMKEGRGGYGI